jgi:formylglycine-generating enzyme required for sulfatase activity
VLLSTNIGGLWADRTLTPLPAGGNGPDPWEDVAQGVTLAANFPTGYRPFYTMRFEITQGQYADFLNTLTAVQAAARTPALADFSAASPQRNDRYRCTLPLTVGAYTACAPGWAMNFLSWEDGIAFADWAGLRPMTELEFEKASRGRAVSVGGEYAWGSTNIVAVRGFSNAPDGSGFETASPANANTSYSPSTSDRPLLGPYRAALFASKVTRELRGESFWGISDLSGNVIEMAVTPARAAGRAFAGEHGDGSIGSDGRADGVASWPRITPGFATAFSATFGFGFRGGDFYNPELDLRASARNVATFGGARRLFGLGFRAVRSAPDPDPPLQITTLALNGTQATLTWPGGAGMHLQMSADLITWDDVPGTTDADSATVTAPHPRCFFRVAAQ